MQFIPIRALDRFRGVLAAQLLSSYTVGTFLVNASSALGTQLTTMPAGYYAKITIEDEQILLSGFSVAGAVVTCTIATNGRGYNGTSAATHLSDTTVEIHFTKGDADNLNTHLMRFDDDGFILPFGTVIPAITDANTHTIAGDYTTVLTVGRAYFFRISSTWYRAIVRSASFGAGTTTFEITGDGLPGSGTINYMGVGFDGNTKAPVDYRLVKVATNNPADNPPAGYQWLFVKASGWHTKDSSGNIRFLHRVRATVSSSAGGLALVWSTANIYDITLTENITSVTHSAGVEGQEYILRIKQHASAAKTVVLAGKTRYSNDQTTYAMTQDVGAYDILTFIYNSTDDKYDLVDVQKGFQTSPVSTTVSFQIFGDGSDGIVALDGTNTYAGFLSKSGSTYTALRDIYPDQLTVDVGVILDMAGKEGPICKTSLVNNGTIRNNASNGGNGNNGDTSGGTLAGGTAGAGALGTSLPPGMAGAAAANVTNSTTAIQNAGVNGTSTAVSLGAGNAGNGGGGGNGGVINGGAASSGGVRTAAASFNPHGFLKSFPFVQYSTSGLIAMLGSPSGGSGGAGGQNNTSGSERPATGGGGGGGGGVLKVSARAISGSGVFECKGGNGGNGGNAYASSTNSGGAGPGGGGSGGTIIRITQSLTGTTTTNVSAGSPGTPGTGIGTGTAGSAGTSGTAGTVYDITVT